MADLEEILAEHEEFADTTREFWARLRMNAREASVAETFTSDDLRYLLESVEETLAQRVEAERVGRAVGAILDAVAGKRSLIIELWPAHDGERPDLAEAWAVEEWHGSATDERAEGDSLADALERLAARLEAKP